MRGTTTMTMGTTMTTRPTGPKGKPGQPSTPRTTTTSWDRLIEAVRESGRYTTAAEAERVTRIVLSALGGHVIGDERVDLARRLPEEAAGVIASQIPATRQLTAAEFVDNVAVRIEGATPATARWDVSSVLSVLASTVGDDLVVRILRQLPPGYALLFGRAELAPR
jgi:uncharacterized protein (DUF2267 family)